MNITAAHVKEIRQEFAKLKPATVTLGGVCHDEKNLLTQQENP